MVLDQDVPTVEFKFKITMGINSKVFIEIHLLLLTKHRGLKLFFPNLRVVQTQASLFLKTMSESIGSAIEWLWKWMSRSTPNQLKMLPFKFGVVRCRIRLFPPLISKIKWFGSELPLMSYVCDSRMFVSWTGCNKNICSWVFLQKFWSVEWWVIFDKNALFWKFMKLFSIVLYSALFPSKCIKCVYQHPLMSHLHIDFSKDESPWE